MSNQKPALDVNILPINGSRPINHLKLFSSYKPVLLFHDLAILLISFALTLFAMGPMLFRHHLDTAVLIAVMSLSVFIFIFWAFNLYSYGANFVWGHHLKRIKKALFWILVSFGLFILLISWENLYRDTIVIPLLSGGLMFLMLFLNSRFKFLTHLTLSLSICLLVIGVFGIIDPNGLSALKSYSYRLPIFYAVSAALLVGGRYLLVHIVFQGWMRRIFRWKMVVIGSDDDAKNITNYMITNDAPFFVKGFISSGGSSVLGCKVSKRRLGKMKDLPELVAFNKINDIVITDENISKDLLLQILDYCIDQRINVWFVPRLLPIINIKIQPDHMCGLPMIKLCSQKRSEVFNKIKHGLDALIALPLFIFLLPAFSIIALAIKLNSEGPVFYKADMIGKNGGIFKMFKFRSMGVGSDFGIHKEYVTRLIKGEIGEKGAVGQTLKITDDPRVTAVGRLLRKFSLDELPQLINVLKGEMSLIGPRPCKTYEFESYMDWHKKRTMVRPGITGVWQVTGRSEVAFEDMVLLDLYYIYNRSLLLDFKILCETVFAVLKQRGAY